MSIGSEVLMPCPISGFFDMIVTMPSAADADERVRDKRRRCGAALREEIRDRVEIRGHHQAAAGQRGDAEERAAIRRVVSMMSPYSCRAACARAVSVARAGDIAAAR